MKKIYMFVMIILALMTGACDGDPIALAGFDGETPLQDGDRVPVLLEQNYPNPFNPVTNIGFQVGIPMTLSLKIYSDDWILVKTGVNRAVDPGIYTFVFEAMDEHGEVLPSGEYFYVLEGGGYRLIRKMKLVK